MDMVTEVNKGIIFIRCEGIFDDNSFNKFDKEIDYLLYKQGISYYTFDFYNVTNIEENIFSRIQNKLIEIFLSCGKVVMCGLSKYYQKRIGIGKNRLFYVDNEKDAFSLLNL